MLEFNIRNQEISRIDNFSPAEKSVGYLEAKFNFKTEDWNGAIKRAIFRNVKSKVEKDAMLEDDTCIVPWEVLVGSSDIEVSVHGVIDTEDITTNVAVFNLDRTLHGGSASQEPSPTVYEQMLKEMQETKEIAQSVRDDADSGAFDGEKGDKGDAGAIEFKIVNELPTEDISESAMYLVPLSPGSENNEFAEYIYVDGHWEYIGSASVEVNVDDFVKKDDYATTQKAGLVQIINGYGLGVSGGIVFGFPIPKEEYFDKSYSNFTVISKGTLENIKSEFVKRGLTESDSEWTDEQKQLARELLGSVGFSDYATRSDAGTMKIGAGLVSFGLGSVGIDRATPEDIDGKTEAYKPIVSSRLDYAVKKALSDCKLEGDDVWTEEEKASALALLGGVDKKYVDNLVGSVESILTELHAHAETKIGGDA